MNLNQPITFPGAGGKGAEGAKGGKASVYPSKRSINLVALSKPASSLPTKIGLVLVTCALVGIFGKFAVADPLAMAAASGGQVAQAQEQLDALKAENAQFAEVNEKYARYVVSGLTEEEQDLADRTGIIDLLQERVISFGYLESLKVTGNTATVSCKGVDLATVSQLVQEIEADPRVSYVSVSTAQGETAATSATIDIVFKGLLDDTAKEAE